MESSKALTYCDSDNCSLKTQHSWSFLPKVFVHDEHTAKDEEYVKRLTVKLYTPLVAQQFRVLKILSGGPRSSLECELLRATLTLMDGARLDEGSDQGTLVEYDALSYSWGFLARTCSVYCNCTKVPVTPQLKNALCSLRHRERVRYVWVDVLCINQLSDTMEKGEQVQLMFIIFSKARSVIGWLGSSEARHEHEYLFAYLHFSSAQYLSKMSGFYQGDWPYFQANCSICDCVLTKLKQCALELVQRNPWFERTWIRQEVFAAKRVEMRYGPYCFDLRGLIQLVRLLKDTYSQPSLQLFHTLVERHSSRAGNRALHKSGRCDTAEGRVVPWLKAALSNGQGFKATEEKDLIFALQNIAQPEDMGERLLFPTIDYQMSSREIFEEFIKRLVSSNSSLNLSPVSIFEDRRDSLSAVLPSWVPDWRKSKTRLAKPGLDCYPVYERKLDTSRPGVLSIDGVFLGTITEVWPLEDYQDALSTSLGSRTRVLALATHKIYRSHTSSQSCSHSFSEPSTIRDALEEIAYRPYRYTAEIATPIDDWQRPYVLASVIARPGDLLVTFAWETVLLTIFGYERATRCSVLRKCPGESDNYYYFLGPCIFDHLDWQEPSIGNYRAPAMRVKEFALV